MKKYYDAVVGVSVNPELELSVEETPGPKKVLRSMSCCLSGSSGNTAMAIQKLGGYPHLLGLVSVRGGKMEDRLLNEAVEESGVPFTPIPVLTETNHAVIPVLGEKNGDVWGKKGDIVHTAVLQALERITRPEIGVGPQTQTFVVITGLRAVEVPFAKALLSQARPGYRILNAKNTLCSRREFKEILPLVDLLVLNQREFDETGMDFSEIYDRGPSHMAMVVTNAENGGTFYFCRGYYERFEPVCFPGGQYETGAGDWFLGALISEMVRLRISINNLTISKLRKLTSFAAKVAGKKITIPGGGNGPSRHQLR